MDSHIDITLLPDPEFPQTLLMNALYGKLHRALVAMQSNRIAVSFPRYLGSGKHRTLGDCIRLHGDRHNLDTLMSGNWLKGMNDHIGKTEIRPVPTQTTPLIVSRAQCHSNVERMRDRRMRRHGESREQVVAALPDSIEQRLELPYVLLQSASTGQKFPLFIRQECTEMENPDATFNSYGLSGSGTVPGF